MVLEQYKKYTAEMLRTSFLFARHGRALTGASPEHAQINVDEEYVRGYANEETPRNGYTKNVFENSEDGVYQYIADNGKGHTCQVIYNEGKMMILVGESEAFNR